MSDIDRVRAFYVDLLGFDVIFEARDAPKAKLAVQFLDAPLDLDELLAATR